MFAAFNQKAVQQYIVQALRGGQSVSNSLSRIFVEIKAGCAKGKIEIDDGRVDLKGFSDVPADIMRQRGRARAPARSRKNDDPTDRRRVGLDVQTGNGLYQLNGIKRRNKIFADTAADQFSIKLHIINATHDNNFGVFVADFGKAFEFGQHRRYLRLRFHDQQVRRGVFLIMRDRARNAALAYFGMGFGQTPVRRGALCRRRRVGIFVEDVNGNPRNRPLMRRRAKVTLVKSAASCDRHL